MFDSKFSLTVCVYLYFLFVGAVYQLGFWIPFNFNVLEFVEPLDLIKSSIYPILPALGWFVAHIFIDTQNRSNIDGFDKEARSHWVVRGLMLVIFLYYACIFLVAVWFVFTQFVFAETYNKLGAVLFFLSLLLFVFLTTGGRDKKIKLFFGNDKLMWGVLPVVFFLPTLAYNAGRSSGLSTKEGGASWVIVPKDSCAGITAELSYAGRVGGHFFGYSVKDRQICVLPDGVVLFKKKD